MPFSDPYIIFNVLAKIGNILGHIVFLIKIFQLMFSNIFTKHNKIRTIIFFKYIFNFYLLKFFAIMGKILQGIFGGVKGKIGTLVGSSWKGIPVLKTKPLSVANPRTAGQVGQRTKFANCVAFAQLILSTIIKPLWDRFAVQMSGFNDFVKANVDLFASENPNPAANLVISKGKMASTPIASVTASNGVPTVVVNWVADSGIGYKLESDLAYILIVNITQSVIGVGSASVDRENEQDSIVMPSNCATSDVLACYLAFKRADGTIVSDTAYLSKTV